MPASLPLLTDPGSPPPLMLATAPGLEATARRYAAMPRVEAEALVDEQVARAIREWRITDATFWQRVKFRSRMIRSAARPHAVDGKEG